MRGTVASSPRRSAIRLLSADSPQTAARRRRARPSGLHLQTITGVYYTGGETMRRSSASPACTTRGGVIELAPQPLLAGAAAPARWIRTGSAGSSRTGVDPRRAGRALPHARPDADPEPRLRALNPRSGAKARRAIVVPTAHRRKSSRSPPADLQPNNRRADRRAAAQPRHDRQLRAGLDAQALHGRPCAGNGKNHAADADPDRAGLADHRQLHHPRCPCGRTRRRCFERGA